MGKIPATSKKPFGLGLSVRALKVLSGDSSDPLYALHLKQRYGITFPQIVLNACHPRKKKKFVGSENYRAAASELATILIWERFETRWLPREQIFAIFGH